MAATSNSKQTRALYLRNFIFGVEDSLVSTVGLLSGIAAAGLQRSNIFLTGVVLIFVEAFSMGVGSYLSEEFAGDYVNKNQTRSKSKTGALIMLSSYFIAGLIPLSPYAILSVSAALRVSILLSLISLFLLGSISAKLFNVNITKHSLRILLIGGTAIAIGVAVGESLHV
jgi:VIT1/CCC1 family predicted Fe2+/Mn2+ transporter